MDLFCFQFFYGVVTLVVICRGNDDFFLQSIQFIEVADLILACSMKDSADKF